jgi:hypothetical protein
MRKKSTLKTITVATGVALALAVSVAAGPGKALATTAGYLSAPNLYTTDVAGSTANTVITSAGVYTIYDVPTSTFGNTIPSSTQLQQFLSANYGVPSNVSISTITQSGALGYSTDGLNLQLLKQMSTNYTATSSTGLQEYYGEILSNVFRVDAGSTMAGVTPGELVFTYQFDVTSENTAVTSLLGNVGPSAASVSFFNEPNGYTYTLGAGAIDTSGIAGTTISCSTCTSPSSFPLSALEGSVTYDNLNGSIETLQFLNNVSSLPVGTLTPEIMVASNATNYTVGSFTLSGSGAIADASVFVPSTPEPGTLVLFGSALGLVAFMMARRRQGQGIA